MLGHDAVPWDGEGGKRARKAKTNLAHRRCRVDRDWYNSMRETEDYQKWRLIVELSKCPSGQQSYGNDFDWEMVQHDKS